MLTIPVGDVFIDVDLSSLSAENKNILENRINEKMNIVKNAESKKRMKIVFIEMPSEFKKNELEKRYLECNGSTLEVGDELFEFVVKTSDFYYIKYIIDIKNMELFIYFENQILKRDFGTFSLTLDGFDYALLNLFLIKYKHLMVHSSAFIFNNKAYLFLGHSGYGKSTIYNNVKDNIKEASMLCEDRNILFIRNNEIYVSDFWREFVSFKKERFYNKVAKLEKVYFIKKSSANNREEINIEKSRLRLFNFFFRFPNDKLFIAEATNLIFEVTTLFSNFYILQFTKDKKFIDFICSEVVNEI